MDWGIVIQLTLAIMGAALVVGGIVAYRGSGRTDAARPLAAAAVAAGAVMLVVVLLTVSVSSSG